MISFYLDEIVSILKAKKIGGNPIISSISIDSRKITPNNGCLFIAIKGKRFDAHNFVEQAISFGAVAILVEHLFPFNIPQLIVSNTRIALGLIGFWIRKKSKARIIALTGSSGKTSVREMITSILQKKGKVLRNEENFNNEIGVPLTLIKLNVKHSFAVIEIGASAPGEICYISNLVKPDTALVNNVSESHLSSFQSISRVKRSKGEIFKNLSKNGYVILNFDSNDWKNWKYLVHDSNKILRFSIYFKNKNIDFYATNIHSNNLVTKFTMHSPEGEHTIKIPLFGKHNVSNALAASASAFSLGANILEIISGLKMVKHIPGRLFPIKFNKNKLILDDSYNANVESTIASINVLSKMAGYRVMVIGDIKELGIASFQLHTKIGKIAEQSAINEILSIGKFSRIISSFHVLGKHFQKESTLISYIKMLLYQHRKITILIKGSHYSETRNIVQILKGYYVNIHN